MEKEILAALRSIEQEYDVKVLYACESGSRAWGFPSPDSDWDVRFFYIHRPEVYLSIDPVGVGKKRDVIERPIHDELDVSGWDLTKTLKLFRKSNPLLLEWLFSDIVYEELYQAAGQMREMSGSVFSPVSCMHHYINMAASNYRAVHQKENSKLKLYFYILRPVLAAKWIADRQTIPPFPLGSLLDALIRDKALLMAIQQLAAQKTAGKEGNGGSDIALIDAFLKREIEELRSRAASLKRPSENPTERLNDLFRQTLKEVWSE